MLKERLDKFNENLVEMASLVHSMLGKSIRALLEKDSEIAKEVIDEDEIRINQMEVENLEDALTLIARFQPTATNMRMLGAGILINRNLERIADHAVNIAESVDYYLELPEESIPPEFEKIVEYGEQMLNDSVRALLNGDEELAKQVIVNDTTMNKLTTDVIERVIKGICDTTNTTDGKLKIIFIARDLERIGDLCTNIAEGVLFVVESELYMHRKWDVMREIRKRDRG